MGKNNPGREVHMRMGPKQESMWDAGETERRLMHRGKEKVRRRLRDLGREPHDAGAFLPLFSSCIPVYKQGFPLTWRGVLLLV